MKTARTSKLPPLYTQVVGSFPRPRAVLDLLTRRQEFTPERFTQIMDDLVVFAIRTQGLTGLDVVSDGEWRRPRPEFLRRVGGFAPTNKGGPHGDTPSAEVIVKRMNPTGSVFKAHADVLVNNTARFTKFVVPGPSSLTLRYWREEHSKAAYPTAQHFMEHLVEILFAEVHALVTAGIDIVQIDEPALAYFSDPLLTATDDADDARVRHDWHTHFPRAIAAINRIASAASGNAEIHLYCNHRNYKTSSQARADYKPLFLGLKDAHIDRVNVEYAARGASGVEELAFLPAHIDLGLGVLDVRSQGRVSDDIETLARAAAKVIPPARLALNPDGGFVSDTGEGSTLDEAYDRLRNLTLSAKSIRASVT